MVDKQKGVCYNCPLNAIRRPAPVKERHPGKENEEDVSNEGSQAGRHHRGL